MNSTGVAQNPSSPRKAAAYRYIQGKILSGEFAAGDVISELALARDIGISRTPIREAIGQLTADGFLEQVAGRGTVVKRPTRADIVELYELREALEVYAVGKVARNGLPEGDSVRLIKLCDDVLALANELNKSGDRRLNAAQMEQFIATDLHFHLLLLRAAGNHRILKVVRGTRLLIRIFAMRREGHSAIELQQIYGYHRGILEAVCASDSVLASQLCGEHIQASRQERLDQYDRWERISQIRLEETLMTEILL
jgi:DNA-binding GntR family transcriptional regulator